MILDYLLPIVLSSIKNVTPPFLFCPFFVEKYTGNRKRREGATDPSFLFKMNC